MLSKDQRREAINKFREQKPSAGIYRIRCEATGMVWVGPSRNLHATRNGVWFSLRTGVHRDAALQREWNTHGEAAFHYEIVEQLDEDVSPLAIADLLKEKKQRWVSELCARGLL